MRAWLMGLLAVVACAENAPAPVAPPPSANVSAPRPPQKREPVVVTIVVDQLSAWVASSRLPELPKDGGFARLLREGTWVKSLRYAHAVTDTAPGHAALHTGKAPVESGIFGNEVPDAKGDRVSILRDEKIHVVAADPSKKGVSASAARLRAETVADRLRVARPEAYVASFSLKDRGAILPAGKSPSWALWFDAGLDQFVTSTAFGGTFPKWAVAIADAKAVAEARKAPWTPTDAAWLASHAATPDDQPGEGDLDGLGTTFPHVARTGAAFRALPASDAMLLALAKAAIDAEYDPTHPTLISLSLSASDVVGHVFGPDSWEAWDQLRKLDAALGVFLDALEKKVGPVVVMLAADHGDVSMPEAAARAVPCGKTPDPLARPCTAGVERISPDLLRDELRAATVKALGEGEWVHGVADPYVYLSAEGRALEGARRATLDRTVRATLGKHKGFAEVFDVRAIAPKCAAELATPNVPARALGKEPMIVTVCRSIPAGDGPGDYYVVTKPGAFFDAEIVRGKGSSHGTPYLYDRTVPMIVRAKGEIGEGTVVDDPVDFSAFAALEAHFLGLDARPASEILAALTAKAPK